MKAETTKIRVYCPDDQRGFEIEPDSGIYCEKGNHYLASEFPPKNAYLEYCCGCQRFIPFSATGIGIRDECPSCERKIGRRYFCHQCQTLTNDVGKKIDDKKFKISAEGKLLPNCPACGAKTDQIVPQIHLCEVLNTLFYTLREVCEFCFISINFKKFPFAEKPEESKLEITDVPSNEENYVLQQPNFLEVEEVTPTQELKEYEEEITILTTPNGIEESPPTELQPETAEEGQITQKKSSSALIGCLLVLGIIVFIILLCLVGKINKSSNNNVSNNSQSPNQVINTDSTNVKNNNEFSNSSAENNPSFRSNSKVILSGAILREEPEYNGYVIDSVEKDTNIRVIDRKTNKSPWYKIKTEMGKEGWIHGDYIDSIDWSSLPCKIGEIGLISGGNLRSSPKQLVNEINILAVWEKGSKVRILNVEEGEPGARSGNPFWFKVQILKGNCSMDERKFNSPTENCKNETIGYMNSLLISCD